MPDGNNTMLSMTEFVWGEKFLLFSFGSRYDAVLADSHHTSLSSALTLSKGWCRARRSRHRRCRQSQRLPDPLPAGYAIQFVGIA